MSPVPNSSCDSTSSSSDSQSSSGSEEEEEMETECERQGSGHNHDTMGSGVKSLDSPLPPHPLPSTEVITISCQEENCETCEGDIDALPVFLNDYGGSHSNCLVCSQNLPEDEVPPTLDTVKVLKEICIKSILPDVQVQAGVLDKSYPFCGGCTATRIATLANLYRQLLLLQETFDEARFTIVAPIMSAYVRESEGSKVGVNVNNNPTHRRDGDKLFRYWKRYLTYPTRIEEEEEDERSHERSDKEEERSMSTSRSTGGGVPPTKKNVSTTTTGTCTEESLPGWKRNFVPLPIPGGNGDSPLSEEELRIKSEPEEVDGAEPGVGGEVSAGEYSFNQSELLPVLHLEDVNDPSTSKTLATDVNDLLPPQLTLTPSSLSSLNENGSNSSSSTSPSRSGSDSEPEPDPDPSLPPPASKPCSKSNPKENPKVNDISKDLLSKLVEDQQLPVIYTETEEIPTVSSPSSSPQSGIIQKHPLKTWANTKRQEIERMNHIQKLAIIHHLSSKSTNHGSNPKNGNLSPSSSFVYALKSKRKAVRTLTQDPRGALDQETIESATSFPRCHKHSGCRRGIVWWKRRRKLEESDPSTPSSPMSMTSLRSSETGSDSEGHSKFGLNFSEQLPLTSATRTKKNSNSVPPSPPRGRGRPRKVKVKVTPPESLVTSDTDGDGERRTSLRVRSRGRGSDRNGKSRVEQVKGHSATRSRSTSISNGVGSGSESGTSSMKRGRGRPRKYDPAPPKPKASTGRGRGRPRKCPNLDENTSLSGSGGSSSRSRSSDDLDLFKCTPNIIEGGQLEVKISSFLEGEESTRTSGNEVAVRSPTPQVDDTFSDENGGGFYEVAPPDGLQYYLQGGDDDEEEEEPENEGKDSPNQEEEVEGDEDEDDDGEEHESEYIKRMFATDSPPRKRKRGTKPCPPAPRKRRRRGGERGNSDSTSRNKGHGKEESTLQEEEMIEDYWEEEEEYFQAMEEERNATIQDEDSSDDYAPRLGSSGKGGKKRKNGKGNVSIKREKKSKSQTASSSSAEESKTRGRGRPRKYPKKEAAAGGGREKEKKSDKIKITTAPKPTTNNATIAAVIPAQKMKLTRTRAPKSGVKSEPGLPHPLPLPPPLMVGGVVDLTRPNHVSAFSSHLTHTVFSLVRNVDLSPSPTRIGSSRPPPEQDAEERVEMAEETVQSLEGENSSGSSRPSRSRVKKRLETAPSVHASLKFEHLLALSNKPPTKERQYICEVCSTRFPYRVLLRTHKAEEHGIYDSEAVWECVCGEKTIAESFLRKHFRSCEKWRNKKEERASIRVWCNYCEIQFEDGDSFKMHSTLDEKHVQIKQAKAAEDQKGVGGECNKTSPEQMEQEQTSATEKCESSTQGIKNHEDKGHGQSDLHLQPCPYCGKVILKERALLRHMVINHREIHLREKPEVCSGCWRNYASSQELEDHISKEHKDVTCMTCRKVFGYRYDLNQHMKNEHNPMGPLPPRKEMAEEETETDSGSGSQGSQSPGLDEGQNPLTDEGYGRCPQLERSIAATIIPLRVGKPRLSVEPPQKTSSGELRQLDVRSHHDSLFLDPRHGSSIGSTSSTFYVFGGTLPLPLVSPNFDEEYDLLQQQREDAQMQNSLQHDFPHNLMYH